MSALLPGAPRVWEEVPTNVLVDTEFGVIQLPDRIYSLRSTGYSYQDSGVAVTRTLGKRTHLDATYGRTTSRSRTDRVAYRTQSAGIRLSTGLTKSLGAHIGYSRAGTNITRTTTSGYLLHSIDAGLDFSRSLSISRRTSLSFTTLFSLGKAFFSHCFKSLIKIPFSFF